MNRLLLCTDLDRTLLPNGPEPESPEARKIFHKLTARDEVTLVYVSGRDKTLVQKAIKNYQLPQPDFVIADVGSTIYKIENNEWTHLEKWDQEIAHDWTDRSNRDLQELLRDIKDVRAQEYGKQKKFKLSYYVPLYTNCDSLLKQIQSRLQENNVNANLIWSVDSAANLGLLDILPANADKKHAIHFLMREYNFSQTETVFAGDSGNDISVMASQINSVLVANAQDNVKKAATLRVAETNQAASLYIAKGHYFGMNGNYSAGIIEGVAHYVPCIEEWLGLTDEKEN